jgi:hypothetical protein
VAAATALTGWTLVPRSPPPSPSASKKEKSVKTKAAVIYADIPCAALKWDPQLGFNGPTTVPYCFDPNINDG